MAREASPGAKRTKEEAIRRREQSVIASHCQKLGITPPQREIERDADGHRVGYLEMSGNPQEDRYMQNMLQQEGAQVVAIPAEKRFRILWTEEKVQERQRLIWERHSRSRRKTETDGGPIHQESAEITHALLDEIDKYLIEA